MNGGIIVQERSCPRCGIRRTVRIGTLKVAFCFNCRLGWPATESAALRDERELAVTPGVPHRFGPAVLTRLSM